MDWKKKIVFSFFWEILRRTNLLMVSSDLYSAFIGVCFCQTLGQMGSQGCFKIKLLNLLQQDESTFVHAFSANVMLLVHWYNLCFMKIQSESRQTLYTHCKKWPKGNWHPTNQPTLACIDQRQVRIDLFVSGLYMCSRDIKMRILNSIPI